MTSQRAMIVRTSGEVLCVCGVLAAAFVMLCLVAVAAVVLARDSIRGGIAGLERSGFGSRPEMRLVMRED